MQIYNSRSEVPLKYKWDLREFCQDNKDFDKKYHKTNKLINQLITYKGCTKDAKKLLEYLQLEEQACSLFEELYAYALLTNDQELGISENIETLGRCLNMEAKFNENISFFAPELLTLKESDYLNLFNECQALDLYKPSLDRIYREKEYILTDEEEKIIATLDAANIRYSEVSKTLLNSSHNYGIITLEDGTKETLTITNYGKIMKKCSREKREEIYKSLYKVINQYADINAAILDGYVKNTNAVAKIHHYEDAWHKKIFELNVPNEVFKTLVDVCNKNLQPLHRFYELKRSILGIDKIKSWDMPLDLVKCNKEYSPEEAFALILDALKPLGKDYQKRFKRIQDERFIDLCQYKGKNSGGYSLSISRHPSRILMSFNGDLDSVSTIAHEGGHNVNHQYICENNHPIYQDTTLLVAEVASLTNECLLSSYLANNGQDKNEKLAGIGNFLEIFANNFYSAIREGKMEQDMYDYVNAGGTLSKDYLNELSLKSLKKYQGSACETDEYSSCKWVLRSHYFNNFYLYNYAICISIASYVAPKILKGDKDMLDRYLKFLSCGLDKWPVEIFSILGIDLQDKNVYQSAINYFDSMIDKFSTISEEN